MSARFVLLGLYLDEVSTHVLLSAEDEITGKRLTSSEPFTVLP